MALEQNQDGLVDEIKRCEGVATVLLLHPPQLRTVSCAALRWNPSSVIGRLVQMQIVSLRLNERITCDEERGSGIRISCWTNAVNFEDVALQGCSIGSRTESPSDDLHFVAYGDPLENQPWMVQCQEGGIRRALSWTCRTVAKEQVEDDDSAQGAMNGLPIV